MWSRDTLLIATCRKSPRIHAEFPLLLIFNQNKAGTNKSLKIAIFSKCSLPSNQKLSVIRSYIIQLYKVRLSFCLSFTLEWLACLTWILFFSSGHCGIFHACYCLRLDLLFALGRWGKTNQNGDFFYFPFSQETGLSLFRKLCTNLDV